jgi:hypothetical protein
MRKESPLSKLFVVQSVGFLAIISLSWLNEWLGLTTLIFENHPIADFHKSALEMLFVLGVWLLVSATTHRLVRHVHYLEGFMRVCAWCRKIHFKGEWIPLEDFFKSSFDTPTTHGVCPKCMEQERARWSRALKEREKAESGAKPGAAAA